MVAMTSETQARGGFGFRGGGVEFGGLRGVGFAGRGFAGPGFKLARALLDKHF